MSATQPLSATKASIQPLAHGSDQYCPLCDQAIPHDRFEEIKALIEDRQLAQNAALTAQLEGRFARDLALALDQAGREHREVLYQEREASKEKMQQARADALRDGERMAEERFAGTLQEHEATQARLRVRAEDADAARLVAEQGTTTLQAELEQLRTTSASEIEQMRQDFSARETQIRVDAKRNAQEQVTADLEALRRERAESEAILQTQIQDAQRGCAQAEDARQALARDLEHVRVESQRALEQANQDLTQREIAAVARGRDTGVEEAREQLEAAERMKSEAESQVIAANVRLADLNTAHQQELLHQREVLERAAADNANAERSAAFQKEQRLSEKIQELQRALDNKNAEELGEAAELNLFEMLKATFEPEGDRIERINHGQPGADILHVVVHNGKECGTIIYDSKNHNAWRSEFATKLAADQMAAKADHAILSIRKFPSGHRHLHNRDGVMLAAPARVEELVRILRRHIVSTHTLRLSDEARARKTHELYAFITSERYRTVFDRVDSNMEKLLDLQVKDKRAHDNMWKEEAKLIIATQKVHAELTTEIDLIIAGASSSEQAAYE